MWCMEDHQSNSRRSIPQTVCSPHLMELTQERRKTSYCQRDQSQDSFYQAGLHPWLDPRDYRYLLEWLVNGQMSHIPNTNGGVIVDTIVRGDGCLGTPLAALVVKSWAIFASSVPSNGNVVSSNCTCALTNIFPLSGG